MTDPHNWAPESNSQLNEPGENNELIILPKTSVIPEKFDPERITEDIRSIAASVDRSIWNVLRKINTRGTSLAMDLNNVQEHLGPHLSTAHYFLNGHEEPQTFKDDQTVTENLLGVKNSCLRNRRSIDNHFVAVTNEINKIKKAIKALESSLEVALNANPKATQAKIANDLQKLQKEVAEALASTSSLTAGSAFNTLDLTNRLVEVEQTCIRLEKKTTAVAKSLGVVKNEQAKSMSLSKPEEVAAIHDRVSKLESTISEEYQPHSRNLFDDMASTRIDLLEREVTSLRRNSQLELSNSETNQWLKQKLQAFLESPEMTERFQNEFKTFGQTWVVEPQNVSRAVREQLAKVSIWLMLYLNANLKL